MEELHILKIAMIISSFETALKIHLIQFQFNH